MSTGREIRLSAQQTSVVDFRDGALLVVAGPGSGKTRVLTERIRSLLMNVPGHFRVLALTFTNKAADEMRERLSDLDDIRGRSFIGTIHSFCLELLSDRGKLVGVDGLPNIFEQYKDRKDVLLTAVESDPMLKSELDQEVDAKARGRRLDRWLQEISFIKAHPISCAVIEGDLERRVLEAYDNGLRACNAYDFDDLLLLAYRLLSQNPQLSSFYQRLYGYICVDEAQDLNEAQYAVIGALCGKSFNNVMLVGDPKQSIYGFNTSSPEYMERFQKEFGALLVELTENFRSARAVVDVARSLEPTYLVDAQLPIQGEVVVIAGEDEQDEARRIVAQLLALFQNGHQDVEGNVVPSKCAVLGRTRFALLAVERELGERGVPYYKRLTANHENESEEIDDFQLALRVMANPRDQLHFTALATRWKVDPPVPSDDALKDLCGMAARSECFTQRTAAIITAILKLTATPPRHDFMAAFAVIKDYADALQEPERLSVYEDLEVFSQEWDQYLRSQGHSQSLAGFMASKALGITQRASRAGVALLTVHSAKGLEFDAVVVAGMAQGSFPDYRSISGAGLREERRNAFVAFTRSKRLLYLSYPRKRMMPWGDTRAQEPSQFIREAGLEV